MLDLSCDQFYVSIHPATLQGILKPSAFDKMRECLQEDFRMYITSCAYPDENFIIYFRGEIQKQLQNKTLLDNYREKIRTYRKLAEYRYKAVELSIHEFLCFHHVEVDRLTEKDLELLEDDIALRIASFLSGCISQLFFSIEFSCKIACSLGHLPFAEKISKAKVVQHQEIFKTLKLIASTDFNLDFGALSKIYAYLIKARMLSDYTAFFFERRDTWRFVPEQFLPVTRDIFNSQRKLLFECLGE